MYTNKRVYELHLELAQTLNGDLWQVLDSMSYSRTQTLAAKIQKKLNNKFYNLEQKEGSRLRNVTKNVNKPESFTDTSGVINLSSQHISDEAMNILSHGLNFAPTPRRIPYEQIITSVEDAIIRNRIPNLYSECLRQDIATMLRKCKVPKSNISTEQVSALLELRNNRDVLVIPADKGNATVIVDTKEYEMKLTEMLSDKTTYKKVTYNPTARVTNKVIKLLQKCDDSDLIQRLRPYNPTSPKIYGLPKVHKPNWPLRPIVSQIDAPTYKLSRYMATILQQHTGKTSSYIKDSRHFVNLLTDVIILPTEVMVSFDITSLFTNVPVDEALKIITDLLRDTNLPSELSEWAEVCLKSGYFLWRGDHYLQVDGVAMGSPIAPVVANLYMEWFEGKAMKDIALKPRYWWRYVDDIFSIISKDALIDFTAHLNSLHQRIQFTVEEERDGCLPFLDVRVIRRADGSITHSVYRKPTHTDRYLRADSHHHPSQLMAVPKTLINRALCLCDSQYIDAELDHIKQVLHKNGYKWRQCKRWTYSTERKRPLKVERAPIYLPFIRGVTDKIGRYLQRKYDIRTYYRPPGLLRQFLRSPKDTEPMNVPGVYKIPCDCGKSYIGETRRNIATRLGEHIKSVKNMDTTRSAVAEHAQDARHYLRFDKASVLAKEKFLVPRKVREAIEIDRHPNFNRDRGWNVAPAWKPVLNNARWNSRTDTLTQDTTSVVCTGSLELYTSGSDDDDCVVVPVPVTSERARRAATRAVRSSAPAARADVASTLADANGSACS